MVAKDEQAKATLTDNFFVEQLKAQLPEYMVPSSFMFEDIPPLLTVSLTAEPCPSPHSTATKATLRPLLSWKPCCVRSGSVYLALSKWVFTTTSSASAILSCRFSWFRLFDSRAINCKLRHFRSATIAQLARLLQSRTTTVEIATEQGYSLASLLAARARLVL